MTPCLLLTLVFAAPADPPLVVTISPRVPKIGEEFHRQHLADSRKSRLLVEGNIELFEKLLRDNPQWPPKKASELRLTIEWLREDVEKMKKYEKELERWEQQRKLKPGAETDLEALERIDKLLQELWPRYPVAPMPREVKPRDVQPKP